MTFRVGMKVVCVIDDDASPRPQLVKGRVYTVSHVRVFGSDETWKPGVGILLAELPAVETEGDWPHYGAIRFRPAVEPKAEVSFTTGADPDSEQYDNRRRVAVPEWGCSA